MKTTKLLLGFLLLVVSLYAQPRIPYIYLEVTPERAGWTYALGEQANFEIRASKNGQPLTEGVVSYEIGPEQMPPEKTGYADLKRGSTKVAGIKLSKPGFVRCTATLEYEGRTYTVWGTAGYDPEAIQPVTPMPADFDEFWRVAKSELNAIPMDARLTLLPEQSTSDIVVYHVELQNTQSRHSWQGSSRFYGILSMPKAPGPHPALLVVPGAGVRPYARDERAAQGVIVFTVGIHGIPVNSSPDLYQALATGPLAGYYGFNMDNRDAYYYKRVFLGCVRAIDFLFSLSEFDGERLAVCGGSQGGGLSVIVAGLDSRVRYMAGFYPAMSDMMGYLEKRAGGWPHLFKNYDPARQPGWTQVAPYYDVVNFARKLTIPAWFSWGYNDNVCPPTSMYAAYNVITAPKELHLFHQTAHWTFPEQQEMMTAWLLARLKE